MFYKILKSEDFTDLWKPFENFILISIRDPDSGFIGKFTQVATWPNCKGMLSLVDEYKDHNISEVNAEKIVDLFLKQKDNIDVVYLHSTYSKSLMTGITAAMGKIIGENNWFYDNGRNTPNLNVKFRILDEYEIIKNGGRPEETWY